MREARKRELMIRDAAKSATNAEEKRKGKRERGRGIKKAGNERETHQRCGRAKKKRRKKIRVQGCSSFFAIPPLLSGKPDPGRPFTEEIHWTFISRPHFCHCFPFTVRLFPRFIIKIANPPSHAYFCYSARTTNPFPSARSTVITRTSDTIDRARRFFPRTH